MEEATFFDFLIVGAGIAGSTLALELNSLGQKIAVIDLPNPHSSSRVAAGMVSPIVPRNVQKSWHCDSIFPHVFSYYGHWETLLNCRFIHQIPTLQVHKNASHTKNWEKRSRENGFKQHLSSVELESPEYLLPLPYGAALIHLSGKLDASVFINAAAKYLQQQSVLWLNEAFIYNELIISDNEVQYRNIKAKKVVFAQGIGLFENPFFKYLPLNATGGDILTLRIKNLDHGLILKRKEWLIPIGEDLWLAGSTYHKDSLSIEADKNDALALIEQFKEWIPQEIELISHVRAPRPTVETWRPFLGQHPEFKPLFVYNGLGSKGSSLVSFLSPLYAKFLLGQGDIPQEVNIRRLDELYLSAAL